MLTIPTFLWMLFYVVVGAAIPLLLLMRLARSFVKSGRKFVNSFHN